MPVSNYEHITDSSQLIRFCDSIANEDYVAMDTEFISEHRYRPLLCLIQVATRNRIGIIDSLSVDDLTPFWRLLCEIAPKVIAHAAREELLFCYREFDAIPENLCDLQLAAGYVGLEYPAAYTTLVQQVLGQTLTKGETRTDWRSRPLSQKQIEYAIQDVAFLGEMYTKLWGKLERLGRTDWYQEDFDRWKSQIVDFEKESQWKRLPGISKLDRRSLGIVRQVFDWRDHEAKTTGRNPRRIIPDDLIVELARRGEHSPNKLKAIRGFTQRVNKRFIDSISEQVRAAKDLPEAQLPSKIPPAISIGSGLSSQFVSMAIGLACLENDLAPNLVATAQDIKDLIAWHQSLRPDSLQPTLLSGWRAKMFGPLIEDIFGGKLSIRMNDPESSQPLSIKRDS